jgi:hypothetical protein
MIKLFICLVLLLLSACSRLESSRSPASQDLNQCFAFVDTFQPQIIFSEKTKKKFTETQLTSIKQVFERLHQRLQQNTDFSLPRDLDINVTKSWQGESHFDPKSSRAKLAVPFCRKRSGLLKNAPDESAIFITAHEYGHAIFDQNIKINDSLIWDTEIKFINFIRALDAANRLGDKSEVQLIQKEITKFLETTDQNTALNKYFDAAIVSKIALPYNELFADVIGLSEFSEKNIATIIEQIEADFLKEVPVKGHKEIEEHVYFNPVRSWLWHRVLFRPMPKKSRDQISKKIFLVIQNELQKVFTSPELFEKALVPNETIEEFNQRLIDALIESGL